MGDGKGVAGKKQFISKIVFKKTLSMGAHKRMRGGDKLSAGTDGFYFGAVKKLAG